jgi:hypothetical protein
MVSERAKRNHDALFMTLGCAACTPAAADRQPHAGSAVQPLTIVHVGSQPSSTGPEANFTGAVRVDPRFNPTAPARADAAYFIAALSRSSCTRAAAVA